MKNYYNIECSYTKRNTFIVKYCEGTLLYNIVRDQRGETTSTLIPSELITINKRYG